MNDKPENFQMVIKNKEAVVERFFELPQGAGEVTFKVRVPYTDDATVMTLHRHSMEMVIAHLQKILALSDPKS